MAFAAAGAIVFSVGAPAHAAERGATKPRIAIEISVPDTVRTDQLGDAAVTFTGIDAKTKVRVNWGDGSATESGYGPCSTKGAATFPAACSVSMSPSYGTAGTFTITAAVGRQKISKVVRVVDPPKRWRPATPGIQPAGWVTFPHPFAGATFTPCATVRWFFDRTNEPVDRSTMIDDVRAGLETLARETGLRFVEVPARPDARLIFTWADLTGRGPDVAGVGGPTGLPEFPGGPSASVAFSSTVEWTKNVWAGSGPKRLEDYPEPGWWWENVGRQSLVIHEVMHGLGFDHAADPASIMNATNNGQWTFTPQDLEGLHTMYLGNPCPPIPDA